MMPPRFKQIKELLDKVLTAGGGWFHARSEGDAIHLRQQCYRFRRWWQEEFGPSNYDTITIRQKDNKLSFTVDEPLPGDFIPGVGKVKEVPEGSNPDALINENELQELVKGLGLKTD